MIARSGRAASLLRVTSDWPGKRFFLTAPVYFQTSPGFPGESFLLFIHLRNILESPWWNQLESFPLLPLPKEASEEINDEVGTAISTGQCQGGSKRRNCNQFQPPTQGMSGCQQAGHQEMATIVLRMVTYSLSPLHPVRATQEYD